jgi:hypothetical protein
MDYCRQDVSRDDITGACTAPFSGYLDFSPPAALCSPILIILRFQAGITAV